MKEEGQWIGGRDSLSHGILAAAAAAIREYRGGEVVLLPADVALVGVVSAAALAAELAPLCHRRRATA